MKYTLPFALLLSLFAGGVTHAQVIEQVLVKVNGEIITKTELEQLQVSGLRAANPNLNEADLSDDARLQAMLAEVTPSVLVNAIDEMLLVQRGREMGLKMGDEQFNQIIENIRKENSLDTDEKFEAALRGEGLTIAGLRKAFEKQMIINRVQQQDVYQRISISEEESRKFYNAHAREFLTPETMTIREIFTQAGPPTPGVTPPPEAMAAARERIDQARTRVTTGREDFGEVAGEVSDAASKANGGLIGPLPAEEINPEILKVLSTLKPGQVSEPMDAGNGYRILKLEARQVSKQATFEEARDQIADRVFQQRRAGEVLKYLEGLRRKAIIEWKNAELKQAWDKGTAEAAAMVAEAERQMARQ
jgi:parvulin-like peptidyl-prolyl isomerase